MNRPKLSTISLFSIIVALIVVFWILSTKQNRHINNLTKDIEFYTDSLNRYTKLYPSESFSKLKKENRELYDKLKEKDDLVEAIQFDWQYKYRGLEHKVDSLQKSDSLYKFSQKSDTLSYELMIWATHLSSYKLNFDLNNRFLLTHQRVGDNNRIEINSQLPGKIQDVTVWSKPIKPKRFGVGISIGAGYGLFTKKPDIFVGVTGTYLIWTK